MLVGHWTLVKTWNSLCQGWWPTAAAMAVAVSHVTALWPQARGSLTNGHESLMVLLCLEASERWKGARILLPKLAPSGHICLQWSLSLPWNSRLELHKEYCIPSPCFQDNILSLWSSGKFLIKVEFYAWCYLNVVLNTEYGLSRNKWQTATYEGSTICLQVP